MPEQEQTTHPAADRTASLLDGRGAGAAWLILKVAQAIAGLEGGQLLEVLGSDPRLLSDLPPVLASHGCCLRRTETMDDGYRFLIAKQAPPA